jgi:hypothetical protein
MRSPQEIEQEIDLVKHYVKYARQEQDHQEEELLLTELDALREELWDSQNDWYRDQNDAYLAFGENT